MNNRARVISILGVVASIATAAAPAFTSMSPKTAQWILLVGTLATAIGGAITSHLADKLWPTIVGVLLAVSGVAAGATGLLPSKWTVIAGLVGTTLSAFGRSVFGRNESPAVDPQIRQRQWPE